MPANDNLMSPGVTLRISSQAFVAHGSLSKTNEFREKHPVSVFKFFFVYQE